MECQMDHIVFNVEDIESMISFYTEVLMLAPERLEEYRAGDVPFPSVCLNANTIIDLFPKNMWRESTYAKNGGRHLNHFCIALSKTAWQDLVKQLEANTIEIEEGPVQRWGAHGTGTSIYFRDPEKNMIEARYYKGKEASQQCLLGS